MEWLDEMVSNVEDFLTRGKPQDCPQEQRVRQAQRQGQEQTIPKDQKSRKPSIAERDWLDEMVAKMKDGNDRKRQKTKQEIAVESRHSVASVCTTSEGTNENRSEVYLNEESTEPAVVIELAADVTEEMLKKYPWEVVEDGNRLVASAGSSDHMGGPPTAEENVCDADLTSTNSSTDMGINVGMTTHQRLSLPNCSEAAAKRAERAEGTESIAKQPEAPNVINNLSDATAVPFVCQDDDFKFNTSETCRHLHNKETCTVCIPGSEWKVMRQKYGQGRPLYMCQQCNFTTHNTHSVKNHSRVHTGDKPYQCNICTYKARQRCQLNTHMYTHTKEKPFNCAVCRFSTISSSHLKSHMRIHSKADRLYCDECTSSYTTKRALKNHMWKKHNRIHN